MGRLSRTYAGTDNIAGLVVADGLTEGSCVVCDGTSEPIGIAVSVQNGLVDIAGPQEVAFAKTGAAIPFGSALTLTIDSDGKVVTCNPVTAEASLWVIGTLVSPNGAAAVEGEFVEVAINPHYVAVASEG